MNSRVLKEIYKVIVTYCCELVPEIKKDIRTNLLFVRTETARNVTVTNALVRDLNALVFGTLEISY